jgi:hypothetical protein
MALAFLFEDDSVMYIDAVESYSKGYSSNIANHPVDKSAVITDHVSRENPSFNLKGVISAADFHVTYTRSPELLNDNIDPAFNNPVDGAVITSTSSVLDYLPGSVQQFLSSTNPTSVSVDPFRGFNHQAARDRLNHAWETSELIVLLDYDHDITTGRSVSVRRVEDCLIQNYTDDEGVRTGDSFEFTMTLQKVRFAYLKEVDIKVTQESVSDAAAGQDDLGDQSDGGGDLEFDDIDESTTVSTKFNESPFTNALVDFVNGGSL